MAEETNNTTSGTATLGKGLNIVSLLLAISQLNSNDPLAKAQALKTLAQAGLSTSAAQNLFGGAAPALGKSLAGAGLGLSLAQIARNKNLSTEQKAKVGALEGGKTAVGLYFPPAAPWIALQSLLNFAAGELQKSSSPQIRGTGRTVGRLATPIQGEKDFFEPTIGAIKRGYLDKSFLENLSRQLTLGGPIGQAIAEGIGIDPFEKFLGIGKRPTTGVQFRGDVGQILSKLGFGQVGKDLFIDKGIRRPGAAAGTLPGSKRAFDIDPTFLASLPPDVVNLARTIGEAVAQASPTTRKRAGRDAFAIQVQNILLNNFGAGLLNKVRSIAQSQPGVAPFLGGPLAAARQRGFK